MDVTTRKRTFANDAVNCLTIRFVNYLPAKANDSRWLNSLQTLSLDDSNR